MLNYMVTQMSHKAFEGQRLLVASKADMQVLYDESNPLEPIEGILNRKHYLT